MKYSDKISNLEEYQYEFWIKFDELYIKLNEMAYENSVKTYLILCLFLNGFVHGYLMRPRKAKVFALVKATSH